MDAHQFDQLTKSMATPASRRRALGLFTAGGLFGAFGRSHGTLAAPAAAQPTTCTLEFLTTVRQGPSASQQLTNDATTPGEARGEMSFGLSPTGAVQDGVLRLTDGTTLPVVGQATGNSLNIRIDAGQGIVFVGVGVGELEIAVCQGAIDGIMSGPQVGDLGDWHAVSLGQATTTSTGGGQRPAAAPRPAGSGSRPASGQAPSPGGTCPAGQTVCAGVCVDLSSDLDNCGACGAVCESRLVPVRCRNGICERASCEVGLEYCGAADGCRDISSDPDHCGGCQQRCPGACQNGECFEETAPGDCPASQIRCDGACVDPNTDNINCGACGEICELGASCQNGTCAPFEPECPPGQTICGEVCVDVNNDDLHCGACFNDCFNTGPFHFCEGGVCVPPSCGDLTDCGGLCVDLNTDELHCGVCGFACDPGFVCTDGVCEGFTCNPPFILCGGECVDGSSLLNCGTCGNVCNPNAICTDGVCVGGGDPPPPPPACNPGLTDCGGVCVDLTNNAQHCGACFLPCADGQVCQSNICLAGGPACDPGLTACGGICLDLMTNSFACGACTNVCAEGQTCQGGTCV